MLDTFKTNQSFELNLSNSTKGKRWYRLAFSRPDFGQLF